MIGIYNGEMFFFYNYYNACKDTQRYIIGAETSPFYQAQNFDDFSGVLALKLAQLLLPGFGTVSFSV